MSDELTTVERFLIAQAFYSRFAPYVDKKDPTSLRAAVDAGYRAEWERTGGKSFAMRFRGEKVGTYSISETKGTPDRVEYDFAVKNGKELREWFPVDNPELVDQWLADHWREFAQWYFEQTGEMPAGCEMRERTVYGKAKGKYMFGKLSGKFDYDRVLELAQDGGYLDGGVTPLLEGEQ